MGRELGAIRSWRSPAASRSRKGDKLIKRSAGVVDIVVGTQQLKMLPMLADEALGDRAAASTVARDCERVAIDNPYEDRRSRSVSCAAAIRSAPT
jgi:hypothetical protein